MTTMTRALTAPLPQIHTHRSAGVLSMLLQARALHKQRRALAALPVERLSDLGLTRDEALREAARPFWDAPTHWRG